MGSKATVHLRWANRLPLGPQGGIPPLPGHEQALKQMAGALGRVDTQVLSLQPANFFDDMCGPLTPATQSFYHEGGEQDACRVTLFRESSHLPILSHR